MPSHLANWMKEQKKQLKAERKYLEAIIKSGALNGLCNYTLVKGDTNEKENPRKEDAEER